MFLVLLPSQPFLYQSIQSEVYYLLVNGIFVFSSMALRRSGLSLIKLSMVPLPVFKDDRIVSTVGLSIFKFTRVFLSIYLGIIQIALFSGSVDLRHNGKNLA